MQDADGDRLIETDIRRGVIATTAGGHNETHGRGGQADKQTLGQRSAHEPHKVEIRSQRQRSSKSKDAQRYSFVSDRTKTQALVD